MIVSARFVVYAIVPLIWGNRYIRSLKLGIDMTCEFKIHIFHILLWFWFIFSRSFFAVVVDDAKNEECSRTLYCNLLSLPDISYVNGMKMLCSTVCLTWKTRSVPSTQKRNTFCRLAISTLLHHHTVGCEHDAREESYRNRNDGWLQSTKINFISICGQYQVKSTHSTKHWTTTKFNGRNTHHELNMRCGPANKKQREKIANEKIMLSWWCRHSHWLLFNLFQM